MRVREGGREQEREIGGERTHLTGRGAARGDKRALNEMDGGGVAPLGWLACPTNVLRDPCIDWYNKGPCPRPQAVDVQGPGLLFRTYPA